MTPRPLGRTGLSAAPLMLGGNVFGWTADRAESFAILDAFVDSGGSLIDTADVYSAFAPGNVGGESETIIGEWLRHSGRRNDVLIGTKVGLMDGRGGTGLHPARIMGAVEESLQRLGVETIDIYFAHRDDPSTPLEESLEAFDRLVREGKVRVLGASNYAPDRLETALAISDANGWARFAVIEPLYNLLQRDVYEGALQDIALREGLAVVPFYALANGLLTGKYRSVEDIAGHAREPYLRPLFERPEVPRLIAAMDRVAQDTGASMVSIAVAWMLTRPGISAPIASVSRPGQLGDLIAGPTLDLDAAHRALLDEAAA
ncbi:aldo/keto reductase [Novosphingobium kaempferiae]|uniref:aldo/keto reductase n=1 Tax=Novosphingobium kaempferiae TaxID=2896849 RepID=UPI001E5522A4|nr:aldo/keto reductase [Novosphingobium kaempferiae]